MRLLAHVVGRALCLLVPLIAILLLNEVALAKYLFADSRSWLWVHEPKYEMMMLLSYTAEKSCVCECI